MRRTHLPLTLILLLAGLVACDPAVQSRPPAETPFRVRTVSAEQVQWTEMVEISGTVTASATAELTARLLARVLSVSVDEGDRVSAGQILVALEKRDLEAAAAKVEGASRELEMVGQETEAHIQAARAGLEQARAGARLAEVTFRRFQALLAKEAVSLQEFDEVRARHESSQAAVTAAEENLHATEARRRQLDARAAQIEADRQSAATYLQYAEIRAPFSGVVVRRMADPGDLASPAVPLLVVEKIDYRLEADVEESLLPGLEPGNEIEVRIASLGESLPGRVAQVAPTADPRTRSTRVKLRLPDHAGLRSGLFGRMLVPGPSLTGILVPSTVIVRRGQLSGVFVVADGRAHFRVIRTGAEQGDRRVVLSGLSPGDLLVLDPSTELQDGSPVEGVAAGREPAS